MRLLPLARPFASAALRTFYRVEIAGGEAIPASGPLLLVANHPNIALLGSGVAALAGLRAGIAAAAVLGALGFVTLMVWQWWVRTRREARLFFFLRDHHTLRQQLLERRQALAEALEGARREAAESGSQANLESSVSGK